uniref:Uncharacterized protein n=1 Tax=Moniliophthora roreri TaxID=221103 RepID=A0A0W0GCA3_MONRR
MQLAEMMKEIMFDVSPAITECLTEGSQALKSEPTVSTVQVCTSSPTGIDTFWGGCCFPRQQGMSIAMLTYLVQDGIL